MVLRCLLVIGLFASIGAAIALPASGGASARALAAADVRITHDAASSAYNVTIDGRPFTSYRHGAAFAEKPVFYPVMAPNGARVNREYPMAEKVPGESSDHPHHQSMFFAYDEVNGTNFWNPTKTPRHIAHVDAAVEGSTLAAHLTWKDKDGRAVLEERKRVSFGGGPDVSWMDHDISLTPSSVSVAMGDTKEGAFAIRLNDTLKEAGGSGRYINAEGLETMANVWGRTSAWVAIRGAVTEGAESKDVTVAIFAHPSGLNFPPYWHARDYGLFAVNPFGRKSFDPKAPERITRLEPGETARLRFRLAVYTGKVSKARLDQDYRALSDGK